jgi:hypothetical protein
MAARLLVGFGSTEEAARTSRPLATCGMHPEPTFGLARIIHRLACRTLLRSPAKAGTQSGAEFAQGSGHAILRW